MQSGRRCERRKVSVLRGSEPSALRQGGRSQERVREGFLEEEHSMRSTG